MPGSRFHAALARPIRTAGRCVADNASENRQQSPRARPMARAHPSTAVWRGDITCALSSLSSMKALCHKRRTVEAAEPSAPISAGRSRDRSPFLCRERNSSARSTPAVVTYLCDCCPSINKRRTAPETTRSNYRVNERPSDMVSSVMAYPLVWYAAAQATFLRLPATRRRCRVYSEKHKAVACTQAVFGGMHHPDVVPPRYPTRKHAYPCRDVSCAHGRGQV